METSLNENGFDSLLIRCPRLGGEVTFAYCRVEGGNLPCARIVQCWEVCIPIATFLEKNLSSAQAEHFRELRPKEKLVSLIELIEAAKGKERV